MYKRRRNLTILIALMLAAVICLCACMVQERPNETEAITPVTTGAGYGVEDMQEGTTEADEEEKDETTDEQESAAASGTSSPTESTSNEQKPAIEYKPGSVSFEEYLKLSADEQQAYALSFPTMNDYIAWYNTEKEKHDNSQAIEITGPINIGELAGKENG